MIVWITRQKEENYFMITYHKPVVSTVGTSEMKDAYPVYGDPFFHRHICKESMLLLFGKEIANLKSLESTQKEILGRDLKSKI